MNMTDTVYTGEREQAAWDSAVEEAQRDIYETLRDLFGVAGENLDYFIGTQTRISHTEALGLIRDLRDAYNKRVQAQACRMTGE